jgi:hypothetical protein
MQVYAQPIFASVERWAASRWPEAKFINSAYTVSIPLMQRGSVTVAPYKLVLSFWPLTVYFPISMHIAQGKITKGRKWYLLQGLSMVCLMISVAVGIGSVTDIVDSLKVSSNPFKTVS